MTSRRFARVYFDDLRRDYPAVYAADGPLATWLRLLVVADMDWPTRPELPRSVSRRHLKKLVEAGLVDVQADDTFAIKGYEKDRARRYANASAAAYAKWGANASANAIQYPDQSRPDQTNTPPPPVGKRENGTNPRATGTNPRAQGTSPRQQREGAKRAPSALHQVLEEIRTKVDDGDL